MTLLILDKVLLATLLVLGCISGQFDSDPFHNPQQPNSQEGVWDIVKTHPDLEEVRINWRSFV